MVDDKMKEILSKPSSDDDIITRWKRMGFTHGLDGEMELKTAWAFENMARTLVLNEINRSVWFANVIFPIIRRTMVEYYEKHNEIKTIETNDYIEFFKKHTLSDIIDNGFEFENMDTVFEAKKVFNKIFEVVGKDTKLIDFDFYEIDMADINDRLEKENPESANHPEDKYNERRYSCIVIDTEAVFVAMITEIIIKEVFEK